jgi:hypothetical protein
MSQTIEVMWLANLLVFVGSAGLSWTLVGVLQRRPKNWRQ